MKTFLAAILSLLFMTSCQVYKRDIMFRLDENFSESNINATVDQVERNYKLQPDDLIQVDVFTNDGERLMDPNFEFGGQVTVQATQFKERFQYLIQTDGFVKLPMIGKKKISGLTIDEAEELLEQVYNDSYVDSFVKIRMLNRRVVVFGEQGGQVIPIENENTNLVEILALYGGLSLGSNAANVRVIRGDLSDPEVFAVDLSTISGMQKSIIDVEAGDIIYVEPWRRPWLQSIRDASPVFGFVTSVTTLVILIVSLSGK
ncbi:MAG: polysaccharide biosynthesis/export family protein [Cyclobacteriaceae bacterium]